MNGFDWLMLFEVSLAGLGSGGLYALAGLAFVLIYKATRVVNLAIGEMLMMGAYFFFAGGGVLALKVHRSTTGQRQHSAVRALQM